MKRLTVATLATFESPASLARELRYGREIPAEICSLNAAGDIEESTAFR